MKQIAPAYIKARKEFGKVLKDKNNPHFKSKYADLAAVLDAVDDACLANDIAIYHETFEDVTGVTVETVFLHSSGESLRGGKLHLPASKQDPQGYGSAMTYARRYSTLAACGLAAEDDDGNEGTAAVNRSRNPSATNAWNAKDTAVNVKAGVERGEAAEAAFYLSGLGDKDRDAVWQHLDAETQNTLTEAWPK